MRPFSLIDKWIEKGSTFFLIITVVTIFILSMLGIIFRWLQISPLWLDPLVRHLVFLSAFLAGILTTGKGKHLAIDLLSKYLESHKFYQRIVQRLVLLASIGGLIWLTQVSHQFFLSELEFGKAAFLEIHSAVWVAIIPVGMILIAYRFFYLFLLTFKKENEAC